MSNQKAGFGSAFALRGWALVLVLLAGCSANHKAIYHYEDVDSRSSIMTVDAKQRAILTSKLKENEKWRRFCSEPSPDVFSVVAQALSAGGAFGQSADSASIEAALNVAFSDAEQGSTIPRTQTINMLRELMFRTCERWLSGAYSDLEMSVQAVRDQRLMVSILAIEQLTGAVTPKPVVIGAEAGASAGPGNKAIVRLDDALKNKNAAENAHEKAAKNFSDVNTKQDDGTKLCDAIVDAVENGQELTDEQKKNQTKCDEVRTSLASSRDHMTKSNDHYADLKRLVANPSVSVTSDLSSNAPGGLDRAHGAAIEKVSGTVKEIVALNFSERTEVILFCFKALIPKDGDEKEGKAYRDLYGVCVDYLASAINVETQEQDLKAQHLEEEIQASIKRMERAQGKRLDEKKGRIRRLADEDKIEDLANALLDAGAPEEDARCFLRARSYDDLDACFIGLPSHFQRNLPEVD